MTMSLRNPIFDNVKFIMIFAVILGHAIEPFIKELPAFKAFYLFIYSFHMPVFIMVAGMLSATKLDWGRFKKLIQNLAIPFIVFTAIYEVGHYIMFDELSKFFKDGIPYWLLWFLPSLLFWRLTLPVMCKVPHYFIISILLALCAGTIDDLNKMLGFSRTVYFWPFFLLGHKLTADFITQSKWKNISKYIWVLILIISLIGFWLANDLNHRVFYGKLSYANLKQTIPEGIANRLWIYLISFTMTFSVLAIIPNKIYVPEHWKRNTLFAYLWHGLFIKIADSLGLIDLGSSWNPFSLFAVLLLISTLITIILSSKYVAAVTQTILFKPFHLLLKR